MTPDQFRALFPNGQPADKAFTAWMRKADAALEKKCGLDSRDLPDWDYMSAFEDGFSPAAAASAALKAAKGER